MVIYFGIMLMVKQILPDMRFILIKMILSIEPNQKLCY
jgi:hypothetical protein